MPQTINGIGTWYYGKKNEHQRDGACEHCGNHAVLTSYDTTNFVVFLYIPLIPLGRYRVVDECGSCTRHYTIPLAEWNETRDGEADEAATALARDPWNAERAIELVRICAGYHDRESLARHEAAIDQALSNDASGMAFLASAYEYFKENEKAESAYRKSLMCQDDPAVRHELGLLLLRQGRPAEAKDYVWHLLPPAESSDLTTLYFLVEAYQARGMHREADEVLSAMSREAPALEHDDVYQKYRHRVRKRLGSTRPLASPLMKGKPLGYDNSRKMLVTAVVVGVVVAAAGWFVYDKTQTVDAYLVNGLDRPYDVDIAGTMHRLAPLATTEVTIPRRAQLTATASAEELGWPATVDLAMATNVWSGLLDKKTYVVNPDRTAVLVWEQTEYRVDPIDRENPTRVHLGRGLYVFDNLHYVFEEFPDEITLDSGQTAARRDRIWRAFDVDPADAFQAAVDAGRRADGIAYLVAKLRAQPDDEATLAYAATVLPPTDFAELAREHLEARPLELDWHRLYQTKLEREGRGDELVETYGALVDAEPDDADLLYLLARVTPEPSVAEQRMRAAATSDPPSAYAVHGLAYQRVTEARFEEALDLSRRAQELDPDNALFAYAETEALMALRRFDALIDSAASALEENPYDGNNVAYAVRLYLAAGQRERAQEVIEAHVARLAPSDGDAAIWRTYLESLERLGAGDWQGFAERSATIEVPRMQYQAAIARGDIATALDVLAADEASAFDHLIAHIAARRAREYEAAESELRAAIAELDNGTAEERVLARCLAGETRRDVMLNLGLQPDAKAVGLAALVVQSEDARLRELGRKLNYGLTFERYYLDSTVF